MRQRRSFSTLFKTIGENCEFCDPPEGWIDFKAAGYDPLVSESLWANAHLGCLFWEMRLDCVLFRHVRITQITENDSDAEKCGADTSQYCRVYADEIANEINVYSKSLVDSYKGNTGKTLDAADLLLLD